MHVSANFMCASPCMFHACFMHVPHTMYMHVPCMEHVRNWNVFHACYMNGIHAMNEPCIAMMHDPCMHGLAVEKASCCVQVSCTEACM